MSCNLRAKSRGINQKSPIRIISTSIGHGDLKFGTRIQAPMRSHYTAFFKHLIIQELSGTVRSNEHQILVV